MKFIRVIMGSPESLREARQFLGVKLVAIFFSGAFLGILAFAVELGFAFSIQTFLVSIKIIPSEAVEIPTWIPKTNFSYTLAALVVLGFLRAGINAGQSFLTNWLTDSYVFQQRKRILAWAFNDRRANSGEVAAYFSDIVYKSGQVISNAQGLLIQIVLSALILISVCGIHFELSMILLGFLLLVGLLLMQLDRIASRLGAEIARHTIPLQSHVMQSLRNLFLLDLYGSSRHEELSARNGLDRMFDAQMRYYRLSVIKSAAPQALGVVFLAAIAVVGTDLIPIAPSLLLTYIYLFIRFVGSLASCAQLSSGVLFSLPFLKQMLLWWKEKQCWWTERSPTSPPPTRNGFDAISFSVKDLSFSYAGSADPVLQSVSFEVPAGSCVVITGPSGRGKSTLLGLLSGLLKPSLGTIHYKNSSMEASSADLRGTNFVSGIAYVGPESFTIEGSIRENLLYGVYREVSDTEIDQALELAECGFVSQLPGGTSYSITEQGGGLSAGQKQRLGLARALLRYPGVLLLDEATSNLDEETEHRLINALRSLKGKVTLLVITHRDKPLAIADLHIDMQLTPIRISLRNEG